jgi:hypothetical protein
MSDIIDFLERMGQDSQLRRAPSAVLEQALRDAGIAPALHAQLSKGDRAEIQRTLGLPDNVCCMIHVPLQEEQEKRPHNPQQGPKDCAVDVQTKRVA